MPAKKAIGADAIVEAWVRNGYQIRATGRELDCHHTNITRRLWQLVRAGDPRVDPRNLPGTPKTSAIAEQVINAQVELGLRSERKKAKGDWRKPSFVHVKPGPIILGVFGDPHLDNPGADLDLFIEELSRRDPDRGIYTCCVGDFFDSWPRALGHLYQETGDPAPAWVMFNHWMEHYPFLFSVSGNHDQFASGTVNFLDEFMRAHGMVMKRSGGTFVLGSGQNPITVAMRHIWRGASQYSEAHSLKRASTFGHTDEDIVVGGHTHQGELRTHIRPHDGRVQKLVQVSSFKKLDNFANDKGFMSPDTPPVVWCVLDEREPVTSHLRAQTFYDFGAALAQQEYMRGRNV